MMSEEEENGDGFIRHRQSWRSLAFNRFIEKIDTRLSRRGSKTTARKREYGTECDRPAPINIPGWMIESSPSSENSGDGERVSDELLSTDDEPSDSE